MNISQITKSNNFENRFFKSSSTNTSINVNDKLYRFLSEHLSEHKRNLFDRIAADRTKHICLVLEDLYQIQNISALFRSAESWGIQDVHVIENNNSFAVHKRIAKGAGDWLTVSRYNRTPDNSKTCFETLRKKGYRIAVTALSADAVSLDELDFTHPTAVVLGTELTGASEYAISVADVKFKIPLYGFTESLNVAAAGAVIMRYAAEKIRKENINWQLNDNELIELKTEWAKKTISWSKYLIELFESGEIKA